MTAASLHQLRRHLAARRRIRRAAVWPYELTTLAPPEARPGEVVAPPDYIGVGVQKAGTTWWHSLIADHPDVHARKDVPKELHYFERYWDVPFDEQASSGYARWFARPPGTLAGEWTPRYVFDFWVPPLLARAAPASKLLVLLRDPVERYRSGIARDLDRSAARVPLVAQDAFHRGLYGAQLARLLDHVDPARLLVVQYERCLLDPEGELERTYRFLGLDPSHRPSGLRQQVGRKVAKVELGAPVADALRSAYASDARLLFERFPELDPGLWSLDVTMTPGGASSPLERS